MTPENQSMLRILRKLAAAVAVSAWLTAAPANVAFENAVPSNAVHAVVECEETLDCNGSSQVCVEGECVACTEDPGQCDNYEYGSGGQFVSPFCEAASGMCWECTDCGPHGCDPGNYQCNETSSCTGYECGDYQRCNDEPTCPFQCSWTWTETCMSGEECFAPCA